MGSGMGFEVTRKRNSGPHFYVAFAFVYAYVLAAVARHTLGLL